MQEALTLLNLPPQVISETLQARARHESGQRRTRLLDLAVAFHPGKDAKGLTKLSKALEKASKPPRPKRSAEQQADADVEAALKHLMG